MFILNPFGIFDFINGQIITFHILEHCKSNKHSPGTRAECRYYPRLRMKFFHTESFNRIWLTPQAPSNTTCSLSDRESATAAHESLRRQELSCVVLFVGTPYFYITSNPKVGFEKKNIKMEANGGINHDLSTLEPLESEYRETAWGIEKSGEKHKPLWIARPKTTDFAVKFEMLVINSCFL